MHQRLDVYSFRGRRQHRSGVSFRFARSHREIVSPSRCAQATTDTAWQAAMIAELATALNVAPSQYVVSHAQLDNSAYAQNSHREHPSHSAGRQWIAYYYLHSLLQYARALC